jgi:hypothetical protein
VHIDHIMVGTNDLHVGMAELERSTGVRPKYGGVHPGRGTRNALISLGPHTYLEIYAPNPAEPSTNEEVAALKKLKNLTPMGWVVSADDLSVLMQRAAASGSRLLKPESGSRRLPNGTVLHWSTFGFDGFDDPVAPFFIHWDDQRVHPSRTSPRGCHLVALQIADPAAAKLRSAIDPLKLRVQVRQSHARRITMKLRCPKGLVTIG